MKKLGFILGATCAVVVAASGLTASSLAKRPERDTRVIVEVNRKLESLGSEEAIRNSQDVVYSNIKQYATSNVKLLRRYHVLNNAFVMEANSDDIENIKKVPGVASVSIDKAHVSQVYNDDEIIPLENEEEGEAEFGDPDNISAATMKKPEDTNDGEGTIIAILDNEFHLQGTIKGKSGNPDTPAWCHEVFSPLADDVKVRYTYSDLADYKGLNAAKRTSGRTAGYQGSRYFNNKVPFYYDYGGSSNYYGKAPDKAPGETWGAGDFDVHSNLGYHGSHVASITAANAEKYKGIAPKAQLALMKVSTDYNAKGLGEKLGFQSGLFMYDANILTALEDAIALKVDGINMSLGSDLDDFDADSICMKTINRLSRSGILTSISAGNAGKSSYASVGAYANWTTDMVETGILGSYANGQSSMIIASGHPTRIFYENAFKIGDKNVAFEDQIVNRQGMDDDYSKEFRMKDIFTEDPAREWVYIPGFGTSADYTGLDVNDKIAVVNRGSTSFADKYSTAVSKGAAALVIINNDPTASDFNFRCSFGDGFKPVMPCALVLYKDKALFESQKQGSFTIINKQVSDNPNKYTVSNFSSDGMAYNLDLKPDITTPGDNIRGAVPEHAMNNLTKEEKESEKYKYKCYQYLSGTSMAAPNYAGAQAVVLSKEAKGHAERLAEINAMPKSTDEEKQAQAAALAAENASYEAYKATVDMRLMSTADPMMDLNENPETNERTLTSPRLQGAGMVDLDGALNTDVYLEGFATTYQEEGSEEVQTYSRRSKVLLRNNPDIARGDVKISFTAHNEGEQTREYNVKLSVLRPALAYPNDIVTGDYNFKGDIEKVDSFTGVPFYDVDIYEMTVGSGEASYRDVLHVTRDIDYFASEADYLSNTKKIIKKGYYYNAAYEGIDWQPLPSYTAQSTKDVLIDEVTGQSVTVAPGDSTVTINPYSLSEDVKDYILQNYEYGCMIEGFVTLEAKDGSPDLSIPYAGFYSGTDRNTDASYDSAPVFEPFNFEKDITKVYPSDLVNDVAKSLIGKDNVNFESMIMAGYAERPQKIDTDAILTNDQSFDKLVGFYKVGTDPISGEYTDNPSNDIYVGNPKVSNTLIIQQFMMRSVLDNYFTITKKGETEPIYRDSLEDMLFGDTLGRYSLYKSHVDANYLSAGYVAHRAYAIVPLFDLASGEAFESGEYELTFNYTLSSTGHDVSKTYTLHIDSAEPVLKSVTQYRDSSGEERVRFYFEEEKLAYGAIGYNRVEAKYDADRGMYYLDETKDFVKAAAEEISEDGEMRLFVSATDYARGKVGCIIHANDYDDFNKGFTSVQGTEISVRLDFYYEEGYIEFFDFLGRPVKVEGKIRVDGFDANVSIDNPQSNINSNGRSASIVRTAIIVPAALLLIGAAFIIISLSAKKRKEGGK